MPYLGTKVPQGKTFKNGKILRKRDLRSDVFKAVNFVREPRNSCPKAAVHRDT